MVSSMNSMNIIWFWQFVHGLCVLRTIKLKCQCQPSLTLAYRRCEQRIICILRISMDFWKFGEILNCHWSFPDPWFLKRNQTKFGWGSIVVIVKENNHLSPLWMGQIHYKSSNRSLRVIGAVSGDGRENPRKHYLPPLNFWLF